MMVNFKLKKVLSFLFCVLAFIGTVQAAALTSEQRFDAVQAKYKNAVRFSPDTRSAFVYVEGAELKDNFERLNTFFKTNPKSTLIIDFAAGDGFVDDKGIITLKKDLIPASLKNLVITNGQQDIIAVGDDFLSFCTGLTSITLPATLTTVGNYFLFYCTGLTSITLPATLTTVGNDFISRCTGLTSITVPATLTTTGNWFLSDCKGLTSITLPATLTTVGDNFLLGCKGIIDIQGMDHVSRAVQEKVVAFLRESNNPAQQVLGAKFYMQYLYAPDPRVEEALKPWNLEMLRAITPNPLPDLPGVSKENVLNLFDKAMIKISADFEAEIQKGVYKTDFIAEKRRLFASYQTLLRPIIRWLFGDEDARVTWKMYPEVKAEMAIVLKHMAKDLEARIGRGEEVDSFLEMMLDSFANCQSRQASELNRVAMMMGLMPMSTDKGNLKPIYAMVNTFKLVQFETYAQLDPHVKAGAVHAYARYFTTINGKIGLPVALQSFKEKISKITDGEANTMLTEFFSDFFTPNLLVDFVLKEIEKQDQDHQLSRVLHGEMAILGDPQMKEIYEEFYGDELLEKIKYPITRDETLRLLKLMGILKEERPAAATAAPAGLFVG